MRLCACRIRLVEANPGSSLSLYHTLHASLSCTLLSNLVLLATGQTLI